MMKIVTGPDLTCGMREKSSADPSEGMPVLSSDILIREIAPCEVVSSTVIRDDMASIAFSTSLYY